MSNRNDLKAKSLNNIGTSNVQKLTALSDHELLAKIAKGDKISFGILYERYLDQIYNYIFFQVNGNHHETEDLTEEVFLRAFTTVMEKPKNQANFKALVYRIAHNLVIDSYRTKKVEVDLEKVEVISEKLPNPEATLENVQLSKDLAEAIKTLKPNLQEVIILRYILDLRTDEIAEIMGISRNYVRVLQYRALQNLKVKI
ncbi:RNA polymerase sigma factor [bacterium]|nr:RNA polymerase sigma factor [bacterium]